MSLTSTHEDYIEAIFRRVGAGKGGVRVSDLAEHLGCRMPTVTRTVRLLSNEGYLEHKSRGLVRLSPKGLKMAEEIAHRHDDVVAFLQIVLGLSHEKAERDACRIEHGLSPEAAQRLHAFLGYLEEIPLRQRNELRRKISSAGRKPSSFSNLIEVKTSGWRG